MNKIILVISTIFGLLVSFLLLVTIFIYLIWGYMYIKESKEKNQDERI